MILTSNCALEEWYGLFTDDLMASAAMDRLLHHAEVVVLEGQSYRNPQLQGILSVVERGADPSRALVCLSEAGVSPTQGWTMSAEPTPLFFQAALAAFSAASAQLCHTPSPTFSGAT